jgi:thioredoxin-dependent peroxiredoxin
LIFKEENMIHSDITIGDSVSDFEAIVTGTQPFKLSDYRGKYLILYFYPKDNTPGCTQEGQDFRDCHLQLQALNCTVVGVSRDSLRSHEAFKAKQSFPFELIADTDEKLCQLFAVIKMKNLYGKQVRGIERSTFLFSPDGVLIQAWRAVKVKGHVDSLLQYLAQQVG